MIITVNGNEIVSHLSIKPISAETAQQKSIPNSIIIQDFAFVEDVSLYEYINGSIKLKSDWEALKEAKRVANLPTFEEIKAQKIQELSDKYDADFNAYLSQYPKAEQESFKDKAYEARAYMADNTVATPYVSSMVGGDETLRIEMINAIWAKVQYSATQEGQMIAKRDAIKACTTQAELDAIII